MESHATRPGDKRDDQTNAPPPRVHLQARNVSCYNQCQPCQPCGPTPLANSCNEPCVRQCQNSTVVIQPSPVVVTLPGPILSSFPHNTLVVQSSLLLHEEFPVFQLLSIASTPDTGNFQSLGPSSLPPLNKWFLDLLRTLELTQLSVPPVSPKAVFAKALVGVPYFPPLMLFMKSRNSIGPTADP
ncbi:feather keratin cos1-1 cos1-3 cos2-1-like isoform x1 [Limosa lapponica baueri]|uniref:Keratin n=1 Tax=Limosa lapponica baueri TaxID=1758121 RepID=A0A2I0TW30_LIMLA|nr:feather keratin cos1-1 cos1-3 cos2-1-like isoform x1 [Limosa lapponica baueri]